MSTEQPKAQAAAVTVTLDAQELALVHEFRDVYRQWQASENGSEQCQALDKQIERLKMRLAFFLEDAVGRAEKAAKAG